MTTTSCLYNGIQNNMKDHKSMDMAFDSKLRGCPKIVLLGTEYLILCNTI
jgi:hypothetical protein